MKRRGKAVVIIVVRAVGRRRTQIEASDVPEYVVSIEGEAVTIDGSNLTLSGA